MLHTAIQRDLAIAQTLSAVKEAEQIEDENKRMIEAVSSGSEHPGTSTQVEDTADGGEETSQGLGSCLKRNLPLNYLAKFTFRWENFGGLAIRAQAVSFIFELGSNVSKPPFSRPPLCSVCP